MTGGYTLSKIPQSYIETPYPPPAKNMKITFHLKSGKTEEITTTPIGFEVTQMGVRFYDESINNQRMITFDKISAFETIANISDEYAESSKNIQNFKSDKHLKRKNQV